MGGLRVLRLIDTGSQRYYGLNLFGPVSMELNVRVELSLGPNVGGLNMRW
jgi:hypothetical protein